MDEATRLVSCLKCCACYGLCQEDVRAVFLVKDAVHVVSLLEDAGHVVFLVEDDVQYVAFPVG